jgi:serine/threonine-protein kinase RsbT
VNETGIRVVVRSDVDVVRARQAALTLARQSSLPLAGEARVDLVVAELATNLLRHAGSGTVVLQPPDHQSSTFVIEASDRGPGLGTSVVKPKQGLGLGLSAVKELSDEVEIRSAPGEGTWIRAVIRI